MLHQIRTRALHGPGGPAARPGPARSGRAGLYNFQKAIGPGRAEKFLGRAGPGWSAYGP